MVQIAQMKPEGGEKVVGEDENGISIQGFLNKYLCAEAVKAVQVVVVEMMIVIVNLMIEGFVEMGRGFD
jgi:hypothetical protein